MSENTEITKKAPALAIVRTASGAIDRRRMAERLAALPTVAPMLDAIGADAAAHYADPMIGTPLAAGVAGEALAPVAATAAGDVLGSRVHVAREVLAHVIGEATKAARKATKSAVRVYAGAAKWAPRPALVSGE